MSLRFPKTKYFRSKDHLRNVAILPCQVCGLEGASQAAHSNWSEHGKGRGIKASDEFTAALCYQCHHELDQGWMLNADQRRSMWDMAYRKTVNELVAQDLWPYDLPKPDLEPS